MKQIILALSLLATGPQLLQAQKITSGTYKSDNELWSVSIEVKANGDLSVMAGGKEEIYQQTGAKTFCSTAPNKIKFCFDVISEIRIYAYPDDGREGAYYNFAEAPAAPTDIDTDCPISQKYMDKVDDLDDAGQVWAYCGYAAMLACTSSPGETLNTLLQQMAVNVKLIYKGATCHCSDAIPASIWNQ